MTRFTQSSRTSRTRRQACDALLPYLDRVSVCFVTSTICLAVPCRAARDFYKKASSSVGLQVARARCEVRSSLLVLFADIAYRLFCESVCLGCVSV